MNVKILHITPLWVAAFAIRQAYNSYDKSDTNFSSENPICGEKDRELIFKVGIRNMHKSVLEHINITMQITDASRALLAQLTRHRIASYTIKSTRFTLKKDLKNETPFTVSFDKNNVPVYSFDTKERASKYLVMTEDDNVNGINIATLEHTRRLVASNMANDVSKYTIPEALKTSIVMTINIRSLQNLLSLRSDKSALPEFQKLSLLIYEKIPDEYKYLLEDSIKNHNITT
jgi:thymidylate synthase (FAD)